MANTNMNSKRTWSASASAASPSAEREHAFDMSASNIRFGRGSTKEVGFDLQNMGIRSKVCVFTDKTIANLPPFKTVSDSLKRAGVEFDVFDEVQVGVFICFYDC
jgi:hydroxyacid-oxoacid transhydrogenase